MLTGKIKTKFLVFVVVAVLGVSYTAIRYAGLGSLFGADGYVVTVDLADSGGIFTNAEVTYRGVTVGSVASLTLTDTGVRMAMRINDSAPKVPDDAKAVVADRSAVGEQFVDLQPNRATGPFLHDGSRIAQQQTTLPPTAQSVLTNLDDLVNSVPKQSLATVINELGSAFDGTGPQLHALLADAGSLTSAARQHLPQTKSLLSNGKTVLKTQQDDTRQILDFSSGINQISDQLQKSDPDVNKLLDSTPKAAKSVDDVLRNDGNNLSMSVANLLTVSQIASTRQANIRQILITYPVLAAALPSASQGNRGHLAVIMNFFNPPPCTKGYEGTAQRGANDTTYRPPNQKAYCAEPKGSPIGVRGSQNAPFGGVPSSPRVAGSAAQKAPSTPQQSPPLPGLLDELPANSAPPSGSATGGIGQLLGLP
jgi:phospholipid/cholesterol/gamma-HCH transport system substrate-binding protein